MNRDYVSMLSSQVSRSKLLLFFLALMWGGLIYVFYPVLPKDWVMIAPDYPKFYPDGTVTKWIESVLAGRAAFVPLHVIRFLGHPLYWQELFFMLATFLAGVAVYYYLRTQNVLRLAAFGGGLFFAFSGYSFTLFCAGHGGYFYLIASGLFSFGLVNQCFRKRRLFYFAMLGATLIWAEIEQPDIWLLFSSLLAAYTVWRSYREWRATKKWHFVWQVYPRFLLTVAVILLIGIQQIRSAFTESLANRVKQMDEFSSVTQQDQASNQAEAEAKKRQEKWIFSTNWSLPPEDMLEFIVPCIFGDDSFHMPHPYWGRLGRPHESVFQKGRMMPNYRQHVVYLGVVAVLFAFYAVVTWLFRRKPKGDEEREPSIESASDVPFWVCVWLACTAIALGRYTPVYRLVYHLPFMSYLRAPVKFHHLVELANACLAGYGINFLLQEGGWARCLRKRFVFVCGGMALGLIVLAVGLQLEADSVKRYISDLGMGQLASGLHGYAIENVLRSLIMTVVVSLCFLWSARGKTGARGLLACGCFALALGVVDQAGVARRCVTPLYVGAHYAENPLVKLLSARTGGRPANIVNYVTNGTDDQDWLSTSLKLHGFENVVPNANDRDTPRGKLFQKFSNAPLRFWQVMGARFVLLPRKGGEPLIRQGVISVICDFEIGRGTVRVVQPQPSSLVLAEISAPLTLPALFGEWKGAVPVSAQLDAVLGDERVGQVVADAESGPSAQEPMPAQMVVLDQMRRMSGVFSTRGHIDAKCASLLVFNEAYDPELVAFVDGSVVPVSEANGLWAAIPVPAGRHEVVLRMRRNGWLNGLSIATSLFVLAWGLQRVVRRRGAVAL